MSSSTCTGTDYRYQKKQKNQTIVSLIASYIVWYLLFFVLRKEIQKKTYYSYRHLCWSTSFSYRHYSYWHYSYQVSEQEAGKNKIWVFLAGVEPMTFWLLVTTNSKLKVPVSPTEKCQHVFISLHICPLLPFQSSQQAGYLSHYYV